MAVMMMPVVPTVMMVPAVPAMMVPPMPAVMVPAVPMMVTAAPMMAARAVPVAMPTVPHLGDQAFRRRSRRARRRGIGERQCLGLLRRRGGHQQSCDREKSKQFLHAKILLRCQDGDNSSLAR